MKKEIIQLPMNIGFIRVKGDEEMTIDQLHSQLIKLLTGGEYEYLLVKLNEIFTESRYALLNKDRTVMHETVGFLAKHDIELILDMDMYKTITKCFVKIDGSKLNIQKDPSLFKLINDSKFVSSLKNKTKQVKDKMVSK